MYAAACYLERPTLAFRVSLFFLTILLLLNGEGESGNDSKTSSSTPLLQTRITQLGRSFKVQSSCEVQQRLILSRNPRLLLAMSHSSCCLQFIAVHCFTF